MLRFQNGADTASPAARPGVPDAVFLHARWHTAGIWIWSCFRDLREVIGFYEPLHEDLAALAAERAHGLRPGTWNSGHPDAKRPRAGAAPSHAAQKAVQQIGHFLAVNLLVLTSGDPTLLTERGRHGVPVQVAAELGSVVQKLNEERARRRAAEQQVRNAEEQLRRVLASKSWKVMQPLRRVRAFLGSLPPKPAPGRIVP